MEYMTSQNPEGTGQAVGRPPTGKKPKLKNVKVTDEVHQQLGEIGRLTEDYGDVVERLIKFYKEHEQQGA